MLSNFWLDFDHQALCLSLTISALEGRVMVMIGCKGIREYSSPRQRYAEEIRFLMPVLQLGLRLFPTSREKKDVGKERCWKDEYL